MSNAAPPLTSADLDRFRDRADRFIAELDEEYYLHYAGHKEKLELAPIFVHLAEESHRFSLDRLLRGVAHQAFERGTCWSRLPQPMLGTRQQQSALGQQTAEWVALCQSRDGFLQGG